MSAGQAPAEGEAGEHVYSYRPSLIGAPWEFRLTRAGIDWVAGRRSGHIPYRDVRRLRLSYKPASMQNHRFLTELWAEGAPKLEIVSSSWKSMVEQERLDRPYADFITDLHRRVARSGADVSWERGVSPFMYWPGVVVYTLVSLGFAGLIVRALQAGSIGAAALIAAFLALFLWQGGNFFRRNRPGLYRPEAPPGELIPGARSP